MVSIAGGPARLNLTSFTSLFGAPADAEGETQPAPGMGMTRDRLSGLYRDVADGDAIQNSQGEEQANAIKKTFGAEDAPRIQKLLKDHPFTDVKTLTTLRQQKELGPALQALQEHPQWSLEDVLNGSTDGSVHVSQYLNDTNAKELYKARADIKPVDVDRLYKKIYDALPKDSTTGPAAKEMVKDGMTLLMKRNDITVDDVGELAEVTASTFNDGSTSAAAGVARTFGKECKILEQNPSMKVSTMMDIISALGNHFSDPVQRIKAMDDAADQSERGTFDPSHFLATLQQRPADAPLTARAETTPAKAEQPEQGQEAGNRKSER